MFEFSYVRINSQFFSVKIFSSIPKRTSMKLLLSLDHGVQEQSMMNMKIILKTHEAKFQKAKVV